MLAVPHALAFLSSQCTSCTRSLLSLQHSILSARITSASSSPVSLRCPIVLIGDIVFLSLQQPPSRTMTAPALDSLRLIHCGILDLFEGNQLPAGHLQHYGHQDLNFCTPPQNEPVANWLSDLCLTTRVCKSTKSWSPSLISSSQSPAPTFRQSSISEAQV